MQRARIRWGWILLAMLVIAVGAFVVWGASPARPMPEALAMLESDSQVEVAQQGNWIIFTPQNGAPQHGLVFYPGGRVDPRAYAPAAYALTERGILVVIVRMPLNLAVLAPNRAAAVLEHYPDVPVWAIGGHSLGGAMAAGYIAGHPQEFAGLLLWAAYPAGNNSLADSAVAVLSISASLDGLATPAKIEASRALLPPDTQWLVIEGGNHAQFGWYGTQAGDNPAAISREAQQEALIDTSTQFILELTP